MRWLTFVVAMLLAAVTLHGATVTVTNVADEGPGSFRQALLDVNSLACMYPCTVLFAIPGPVPEAGYFTISPLTPLPILFADYLTIDGSSQSRLTGNTNPDGPEIELDGSKAGYRSGIKLGRVVGMTIRGLAINRFEGHGIFIDNSSNIEVSNCYIGVDPTASRALPNGFNGVAVHGTYGGIRILNNTISGNRGNGIFDDGFFDIRIAGNRIGNGRNHVALGNGANGIDINSRPASIISNEIVANHDYGVVVGDGCDGILMQANAIYGNGLMSIGLGHDGPDDPDPLDADTGANGRLNAPELTFAHADATLPGYYIGRVTFTGRVQTKPNTRVTIDAYAAPYRSPLGLAEANMWIGSNTVTTDANGVAAFSLERAYGGPAEALLIPDGWLAATITTAEGTSELSAPVAIQSSHIDVTSMEDSGPGSLREAIQRANAGPCTGKDPCWITFDIPDDRLTNGVAVFKPLTPLPAITSSYVHIDGSSERWRHGAAMQAAPPVEIRGTNAGVTPGLRLGTATAPITEGFVDAVAVTGFQGDGIVIEAVTSTQGPGYDVRINDAMIGIDPATGIAAGNSGDGVVVHGARLGAPETQWVIRNSVIGSNGGHGVRLDAAGANVRNSRIGIGLDGSPRPNGGAGVFAGDLAYDVAVTGNTIAHNTGAGVSTSPLARAVNIDSLFYGNGGPGIDRNADGAHGAAVAGVTSPPIIQSATYDPAKKVTVVGGELTGEKPVFALPIGSGDGIQLAFFHNAAADPSGYGEGEVRATGPAYFPLVITGNQFRAELPGDLRGRFVTATASYAICWWEFGCHNRDTSEFSNAFEVK